MATDIAVLCENVPPQWQEPAHHCTDRRRGQYGGAVPYVERFDLRIQGFRHFHKEPQCQSPSYSERYERQIESKQIDA